MMILSITLTWASQSVSHLTYSDNTKSHFIHLLHFTPGHNTCDVKVCVISEIKYSHNKYYNILNLFFKTVQ